MQNSFYIIRKSGIFSYGVFLFNKGKKEEILKMFVYLNLSDPTSV